LTADWVVITAEAWLPRILLIRRARAPYAGAWALPGGFIEAGETIEAGAARELREETGLTVSGARQVGAFGDPGRDPRGWVVSVAFAVLVDPGLTAQAIAGDDAATLAWWPLDALPTLAFDHARIIAAAQAALR
jgi:8-oxo-dGTP diphosphatase